MLSSVSIDEFKATCDGSLCIYRQTNITQTKGGSKIRPLGLLNLAGLIGKNIVLYINLGLGNIQNVYHDTAPPKYRDKQYYRRDGGFRFFLQHMIIVFNFMWISSMNKKRTDRLICCSLLYISLCRNTYNAFR